MTITDFSTLIIKHEDILQPYAITLTRNTEDAKDLYQETMLRAVMYREKYRMDTNLKAWLYTIMRNTFINNYRRNKNLRRIQPEYEEACKKEMTNDNEGSRHMRMREIKNKIAALPDILRISFELYYTGYKYHEIAKMLDEPIGTVKSRIHIARKQLTKQIDR